MPSVQSAATSDPLTATASPMPSEPFSSADATSNPPASPVNSSVESAAISDSEAALRPPAMSKDVSTANASFNQSDSATLAVDTPVAASLQSEKCAVRVGVSKYMPESEFEQLLTDANVEFDAVFKKKNRDRALVTFSSLAAKQSATEIISSFVKKDGSKYKLYEGEYQAESASRKRNRAHALKMRQEKRARFFGDQPFETVIKSVGEVVTPWSDVPYLEQLAKKRDIASDCLASVMINLRKDFKSVSSQYPDLDLRGSPRFDQTSTVRLYSAESGEFTEAAAKEALREVKGTARLPCPLNLVVGWQDDGIQGYRNKCEFTIGVNDKDEVAIGYNCGRASDGRLLVSSAVSARNAPAVSRAIAGTMQQLVHESAHAPFVQVRADAAASGVWRRLLVRVSNATKQVMLAVVVDAARLSSDVEHELQQQMLHKFREDLYEQEFGYRISTIVWQQFGEYGNAIPNDLPSTVLRGDGFIVEQLNKLDCAHGEHGVASSSNSCSQSHLNFQVQPSSFFQVNTAGANVLYKTVAEFLDAAGCDTSRSVLADVCCGTGTIGMTLAKRFDKVIGFEMVESAVADARSNAAANKVDNIEFVCGKAEDTLQARLSIVRDQGNVVAIVDPPRPGLHANVLKALRACSSLDTLVYVSCNPKSMASDIATLSRPVGTRRVGQPFRAIKAALVDMFPETPHCECVVLMQRPDKIREREEQQQQQQQRSDS